MLHGLRLSLLPLCLAACASQFLVVPDSDWQTVPAPVRASVDKQNDAGLASANAELAAASASMAALQRSQPAPLPPAPAVTVRKPDPDSDAWDIAIYEHAQARIAAFTRVENARVDWQRTNRAWRERWLAAAEARVEMVTCERELVRAQTIDRNLPGSDRYDTAPLRGQFSRAQQRWHILATSAREARTAHERASATLASSKEAYAQLMRSGPGQGAIDRTAADDRAARLELSGWMVTRGDIKRRRGLRNYLDTAAKAPPALRKRALKLRSPVIVIQLGAPTPEAPPAETPRGAPATPGPATAPANSSAAAPGAATSKPATPNRSVAAPGAATSKPVPNPGVAAPVAATSKPAPNPGVAVPVAATSKPAVAPAPPATGKPPFPARGKATGTTDNLKPWDILEPAGMAAKPAARPTRSAGSAATAPSPKPWDLIEPVARPSAATRPAMAARPAPASAAPATLAPAAVAAKPASAPAQTPGIAAAAKPPAAPATTAKTAERAPPSPASRNTKPATTSAAKPVESPTGTRTP